jgi:CHAT domain-containing protein/tetratricopeptide (TPR) repeat protein
VELCQRALALVSRAQNPQLWAALQNELANGLAQNPLGNRSENLEQAIAAYQQALTVMTQSTSPVEWAQIMMNLGNAYAERIQGDKAENIKAAIDAYNQALIKLPKAGNEQLWAALQSASGNALKQYYRGNREEHIEATIQAYEQALTVQTQSALPTEWAQTMMNLGNAYRNRIRGNKVENIELAIQSHKQALTVQTQSTVPGDWAATMNSLGNAYRDRIWGNRAENIEAAIAAYNQALTVRTQSAMSTDWAQTMMNLGNAYAERIRGDKAENIEVAIAAYNQALIVRTRDTMPVAWAITMMNLGNAYRNRIKGSKAENIEVAIQALGQARPVMKEHAMLIDWAIITNNLGNACAERIRGDKAKNIEAAIVTYHQALAVRAQDTMPGDWAQTMMNLGNAYADRVEGNRAGNIEQAIAAYQQALTVRKREVLPADHRLTQRNLGNLYFREKRWGEAAMSYAAAIEVGNDLLATAYTDAGRRSEISETAALYANVAYCQLQLNQPSKALVRLEQGKTRLLAEALALADADLAGLPPEQRSAYQTARDQIRELEAEYRLPPNTPARRDDRTLAALLETERARLRELIAAIRETNPDFMPEGLGLSRILGLIPEGGALVAPLFTSQGSAVFVIPHGAQTGGSEHIIPLDDFTTDSLNELLVGTKENPGWLPVYIGFRNGIVPVNTWFAFLNEYTGRLWDVLVGKIHARLVELGIQPEREIILMPQGGLGLLPLHAAWRLVDGKPHSLLDEYVIRYAPSAYALDAAQRRLKQRNGDPAALIVGVSDPRVVKYRKVDPLLNVRAEAEGIAKLLNVTPLLDVEATKQQVLQQAARKSCIHFACHGGFDWLNPFGSELVLAGDEPLLLSDLVGMFDLDAARLVTLSACETGITDVSQSPDEYLGLPAGFMQAGAPGVVSSLWTVDDSSTALLMVRFYQFHQQDGLAPAAALRQAQLWLRDAEVGELEAYYESFLGMNATKAHTEMGKITKQYQPGDCLYANPYFWAAFTFNGV